MGTSESEHNSKDHNESDDVISGELEQNNDSDNNGAEDVVAELVSSFLNTAPRGHRRVASSPALYTTSTSPQGHHRRTSSRYSDRSHRRTGSRYSGRSHRRMPTPLFGDDIVEEGTLFRKPSTGGYSYNSRYHEEDYDSDDFSTESSSGDGPPEHMEEGHLEQPDEKEERMRRAPPKLVRQESMRQLHGRRRYNWRKFLRARTIKDIFHWLAYGFVSDMKQSREEMLQDLANLARLLKMLRDYYDRFGLPAEGGPRDQEHVLRVVTKELYSSGCPVWALESVMQQVSEGLTGNQGVDFLILPKKAFIFAPSSGATVMFRIKRGFNMRRLDDLESVAVRLASFASNTKTVASIPIAEWPSPEDIIRARRDESVLVPTEDLDKSELASSILKIASESQGIFYYMNSKQREIERIVRKQRGDLQDFWMVDEDICDLFSRLATIEAMQTIEAINDENKKTKYPALITNMFELFTSAGAAAIWFEGSWYDILVAGFLGVLVSLVGATTGKISKDGRIISEVCSSFSVGLSAGIVALIWPGYTCFGAMAVSGIIDILQGFPIVYAVIELMGRHSVTGGADFLEAMLYNTLIAVFLKFGQYTAVYIMNQFMEDPSFKGCQDGISNSWYYLFTPLAALGWSGMFNPYYRDLPLMATHGILAYLVSFGVSQTTTSPNANYFVAAMSVTLMAGITSRFTGRNALACSIAGLYVLLPGSYLMNEVYTGNDEDATNSFLQKIILRSILIGIGAWTGSLLCSHTILGSTRDMLKRFTRKDRNKGSRVRKQATGELLFF